MAELSHAAGLAYREAGDSNDRVVLLVHGYPESSYMWHEALPSLADAGWRALAPDLPGYGDSEPEEGEGAGTWERHVAGARALRTRARARPGGARDPRLGRDDRAALGLRSPGRGERAGDLRRRLLRRSALARSGERDAHTRRWRGVDPCVHARGLRGRNARDLERHETSRRSPSTGRASPTTPAAWGTSSCTARATSRSSFPTRAASPRSACRR